MSQGLESRSWDGLKMKAIEYHRGKTGSSDGRDRSTHALTNLLGGLGTS